MSCESENRCEDELAARVDMNILRWFGHVERMDNE